MLVMNCRGLVRRIDNLLPDFVCKLGDDDISSTAKAQCDFERSTTNLT
jgi:hypothetical protein